MITRTIIKHPMGTSGIQSEPSLNSFSISTSLGTILQKHNVLKHPFFQLWNCGGLTPETIKAFTCQFYQIVNHFPRMISAVHSNTLEISVRRMLLDNLYDEDGGKEHSSVVWIQLAESLGITKGQLEHTVPLPLTKNLLETMNSFCRTRSFVEGLASLYALEVQLPDVFKVKVEGLQQYYHTSEKKVLKYFTLRQGKNSFHSAIEKELIEKNVNMENYSKVTYATEATAFAFWRFHDGIMEIYGKSPRNTFSRL